MHGCNLSKNKSELSCEHLTVSGYKITGSISAACTGIPDVDTGLENGALEYATGPTASGEEQRQWTRSAVRKVKHFWQPGSVYYDNWMPTVGSV